MLGTVLIAAIAASSIGFNLRFLLALCRECKPRWICYLLRLQPETNPTTFLMKMKLNRLLSGQLERPTTGRTEKAFMTSLRSL
jgi:hypothetical protein